MIQASERMSSPVVEENASEKRVRELPRPAGAKPRVNLNSQERLISGATGAGLCWAGTHVRGLWGLGIIGFGFYLVRRGVTGHCGLYEKLDRSDAKSATATEYAQKGIHVEVSYTIEKPRAELFAYWRDFGNLPKFMKHLNGVTVMDEKRSHWRAKAPAGREVEWYAEIINEVPDELIAWRSLSGADVDNAGSIRFLDAAGGRGTEVRVVMDYIPPAGKIGKWVATVFLEAPELTIKEDLRRFKQLMEAGDIPTTEGQSRGNCNGTC